VLDGALLVSDDRGNAIYRVSYQNKRTESLPMARLTKKRSQKAGLPAGSLVHIGEKKTEKTTIKTIAYDQEGFREIDVEQLETHVASMGEGSVTWININGIHEKDVIEKIGKLFSLHPLLLEDIMNTDQRPKMEEHEGYLFIVLKMLSCQGMPNLIKDEQVTIVFGHGFLISFQESEPDEFSPVREMIKNGRGRIKRMGSDYLAYSLMDVIVDNYFVVMEKLGEEIEGLETELIKNSKLETLRSIHRLKREMIFIRRSIWPLREVIGDLERRGSMFIQESTSLYLRDIYDHIIHVIDTTETFRDIIAGMIDIYLSSVSNKMNEIMKVLTIIATIFIPLTWIVGIYGMNFDYMPELRTKLGYPIVMAIMVVIGVLMLLYFKRKKWF
jgi:magnesium transporter